MEFIPFKLIFRYATPSILKVYFATPIPERLTGESGGLWDRLSYTERGIIENMLPGSYKKLILWSEISTGIIMRGELGSGVELTGEEFC